MFQSRITYFLALNSSTYISTLWKWKMILKTRKLAAIESWGRDARHSITPPMRAISITSKAITTTCCFSGHANFYVRIYENLIPHPHKCKKWCSNCLRQNSRLLRSYFQSLSTHKVSSTKVIIGHLSRFSLWMSPEIDLFFGFIESKTVPKCVWNSKKNCEKWAWKWIFKNKSTKWDQKGPFFKVFILDMTGNLISFFGFMTFFWGFCKLNFLPQFYNMNLNLWWWKIGWNLRGFILITKHPLICG